MPGDPWAQAQANTAVKYDAQQNAIQRMLDQTKANTIAGEQSLAGFGQQGRDIIGSTYNTLYGLLGQSKAQNQADLGRQVDITNQGYDQAISNIQQYGNTSSDYLNQMAQQLGQQGAGLRSNTELADIVGTSLGRANSARANYGGNLADWAARVGGIADQGIDSAHQSQALRSTEFESQLMKLLGENRLKWTEQETGLQNEMTDLLGNRQNDLINMYNELAQQEWENAFAQAQLDQQAAEAAAARASAYEIAAMQESGANSRAAGANAASAKDDALDWAKFEEAKRQFDLEFGKADPEDLVSIAEATGLFSSGALGGTYDFMGNFQPDQGAKDLLNRLITEGRGALKPALRQGATAQAQAFNPNLVGPVGPQYDKSLQRTASSSRTPSGYDQWRNSSFMDKISGFNTFGKRTFGGGIGALSGWL